MNYLEQIVAFQRWKDVNPLPASAIALWYELMAACNKAGWPEEFTIQNAMLQATAGLSRKEFERARQILINLGRIHYTRSKRVNTAGNYEIIPIPIVKKGHQEEQQEGQRKEHRRGNERDTSLKDLKAKRKRNETNGNNPPVSPKGEPSPDKIQYADYVFLTEDEYRKLTELLGEEERDRFFLEFASWISGKPTAEQKRRSAYLTILNWHRREQTKPKTYSVRSQQQSQYQRTVSKLDQMYQEAIMFEQSGSH